VPATREEAQQWSPSLKQPPLLIRMGARRLMPLQLEPGAQAGTLESKYYDPAGSGWSATVAVTRFK
jgi:hypothetical protein